MLTVTITGTDGEQGEPVGDLDYVLFTNDETFGGPQVLSPETKNYDNSDILRILYVNPTATQSVLIEKDDSFE